MAQAWPPWRPESLPSMLTIRNTQLQTLGQRFREEFIDGMLAHLYSYFPAVAWLLTQGELRSRVNLIIERAAVYQLTSQQQVCRFINLAATYGWEFDGDPDLLWMRSILIDTSLTQPGERLDRLVQTCLHRQGIEEHNRALQRQLGLSPVEAPSTPEPNLAVDYSGQNHYANTQPTAANTEEIIIRNPLGFHLSRSLWHSLDAMPAARPSLASPAWVNDASALLRQKTRGRHVRRN